MGGGWEGDSRVDGGDGGLWPPHWPMELKHFFRHPIGLITLPGPVDQNHSKTMKSGAEGFSHEPTHPGRH